MTLETIGQILYNLSLPFAAVALLAFLVYTCQRTSRIFAVATIGSFVAFLCLTLLLPVLWAAYGTDVFFMSAGTREILYAWVIMVIYFGAEYRYRIRLLGPILMPVALFLLLMAMYERETPVQEIDLGSIPTLLHVLLVLAGFGLLFLAFAAATLYLLKTRALKRRIEGALDDDLPAVTTLRKLMSTAFQFGFALLTIGLLLGSIYAGARLEPGWFMHPFILTAAAAWCFYAGVLLVRLKQRLSNQAFARLVVVVFVVVVAIAVFGSHRTMLQTTTRTAEAHGTDGS